MKKRIRIARLLDRLYVKGNVKKVVITGSASGLDLYEGTVFYVPYGLSCDYVKEYRLLNGILMITSTCDPLEH